MRFRERKSPTVSVDFALARPEGGIRFLLRPFLPWGRMVHSVGTDSKELVETHFLCLRSNLCRRR